MYFIAIPVNIEWEYTTRTFMTAKKHPHRTDSHFLYGFHPITTLLEKAPETILVLYAQKEREDQRLQKILKQAAAIGIAVEWMNKEKLDHLVPEANSHHQGLVAKIKKIIKEESLETLLDELNGPVFLLILDGVQDPHNLGACLRSANAAGVHAVIVPKDKAVGLTPVVRKVASGAAELTPFFAVTNLARTLDELKQRGIWLFGATEHTSESLYKTDLTGSIALVLGAEGTGLRRLTADKCDQLFCIPTSGEIKSLNVSVAAGICLFEAVRQKLNLK